MMVNARTRRGLKSQGRAKCENLLPRAPRAVSTREMASRMRSNNALIEARLTPARTGQMRTMSAKKRGLASCKTLASRSHEDAETL